MSLPDCASVGRVRRPHGVRGELVVEPLTDEPDAIFAPGSRLFQGTVDGSLWLDPRTRAPRELTVRSVRPFKDSLLIIFDAVADRTEAERWNGRHLLVPVDELSEPGQGEVFAHELIGMSVIDAETRQALGEVVEFYELPQGLLLEFKGEHGVASFPFMDEFVKEVRRDDRVIEVVLPDGLIE